MRVVWTRGAGSQFEAAYRYLAKESPRAAAGFLDAVEKLEANLGRFPRLGVSASEHGVFSFPLSRYRYRVFYKIDPDAIRIRHISRRPLR